MTRRTDQIVEALTIAEDILSRSPHSTQIAANGMHPQIVIEKIRTALEAAHLAAGEAGEEAERWVAVDEQGSDNFATSIYENTYHGLLIARCNQNGSHPWQAPAILRGLSLNKALPTPAATVPPAGAMDAGYDPETIERCAQVAEDLSWGADIDWWFRATKKEVSARAAHEIASAIRALGGHANG